MGAHLVRDLRLLGLRIANRPRHPPAGYRRNGGVLGPGGRRSCSVVNERPWLPEGAPHHGAVRLTNVTRQAKKSIYIVLLMQDPVQASSIRGGTAPGRRDSPC